MVRKTTSNVGFELEFPDSGDESAGGSASGSERTRSAVLDNIDGMVSQYNSDGERSDGSPTHEMFNAGKRRSHKPTVDSDNESEADDLGILEDNGLGALAFAVNEDDSGELLPLANPAHADDFRSLPSRASAAPAPSAGAAALRSNSKTNISSSFASGAKSRKPDSKNPAPTVTSRSRGPVSNAGTKPQGARPHTTGSMRGRIARVTPEEQQQQEQQQQQQKQQPRPPSTTTPRKITAAQLQSRTSSTRSNGTATLGSKRGASATARVVSGAGLESTRGGDRLHAHFDSANNQFYSFEPRRSTDDDHGDLHRLDVGNLDGVDDDVDDDDDDDDGTNGNGNPNNNTTNSSLEEFQPRASNDEHVHPQYDSVRSLYNPKPRSQPGLRVQIPAAPAPDEPPPQPSPPPPPAQILDKKPLQPRVLVTRLSRKLDFDTSASSPHRQQPAPPPVPKLDIRASAPPPGLNSGQWRLVDGKFALEDADRRRDTAANMFQRMMSTMRKRIKDDRKRIRERFAFGGSSRFAVQGQAGDSIYGHIPTDAVYEVDQATSMYNKVVRKAAERRPVRGPMSPRMGKGQHAQWMSSSPFVVTIANSTSPRVGPGTYRAESRTSIHELPERPTSSFSSRTAREAFRPQTSERRLQRQVTLPAMRPASPDQF